MDGVEGFEGVQLLSIMALPILLLGLVIVWAVLVSDLKLGRAARWAVLALGAVLVLGCLPAALTVVGV